ncbi:hypothetical protein L596_016041 [Steinernema carpocapsae]|nr:hypothetical protein L596_016041 [Steinernema carpocapsae]
MEAYDHIHDVNIKSIIKLNNLTLPYLEQTKGNIVHVSSVSAVLPRPSRTYYSMSKAALDHYMRNKTDELARKGIRINNVNPGMVRTNILNAMGIPEEKQQSFYDHYQKSIPLGRPAESEEIAKTIAFLASSDASYITGVALLADGGNAQLATV